jgi:hypothetical protein
MARLSTWQQVSAKLDDLKVNPASFTRRCDISESTFWRGVKAGSTMQPSTASVVNRVLSEIEQERAA